MDHMRQLIKENQKLKYAIAYSSIRINKFGL